MVEIFMISQLMTQLNNMMKLDFSYFEKNCRLIAVDVSKQKALDADSRAIQQIIFTGKNKSNRR